MLNSKYNDIILGKNYLSVLFGLLRLKRNESDVLIIDPDHTNLGKHWCENIGSIEKQILMQLGERYNLSTLKSLERYITPLNTLILIDETMIEFGKSSFANIKEIARKIPECIPAGLLKTIENYGEGVFNKDCEEFFSDLAKNTFDPNKKKDIFVDKSSLKILFDQFSEFINNKSTSAEQFHFVLQVLFQTYFSNIKSSNGSRYLLTSLLSPRYKVDETKLLNDLIFEYKSLGGALVETDISNLEIYKNKIEFLKLESLDGIIDIDQMFLFSNLNKSTPFEQPETLPVYHTIELKAYIEHEILDFYKYKRIIVSNRDKLGTDFPHFEIYIDDDHLKVNYSYANELGTKPSFFYKKATEEVFRALENLLPGLNYPKYLENLIIAPGYDIWNQVLPAHKKSFKKRTSKIDLINTDTNQIVENINYFGPFRIQTLGLYSYLWDICH